MVICSAGIPRYPYPYTAMVRPAFPPRPPGPAGILPPLSRPPIHGFRGPILPPIVRPAVIPIVTPIEKPQTIVYVGKIASTVENDFMTSLLQLCGPVKSWKRAQDPSNGTLKGFGFCEFDSAEGVLRALRLLSKVNIDGQELMLRNLLSATSKHDVYLMQNYAVMHWSSLMRRGKEVLNVAKAIVPNSKYPGSLAQPLSRVQISTMAVKDNLMVAGGFQGELICKDLQVGHNL